LLGGGRGSLFIINLLTRKYIAKVKGFINAFAVKEAAYFNKV
jgi:hypothetical protein